VRPRAAPRSASIEKYLASRQHELGEKTYGQTKLLLGRLKDYCERQGVYFARELKVDLRETFKFDGLPDLADTSKSTAIAKLRCFLRDGRQGFCWNRNRMEASQMRSMSGCRR